MQKYIWNFNFKSQRRKNGIASKMGCTAADQKQLHMKRLIEENKQ